MIILCDCDGVLCDFDGQFRKALLVKYDFDLPLDHKDFGFTDVVGWRSEFWNACHEEGFVAAMDVLPGSQHAIDELRPLGRVVCVTAPFDGARYWMNERVRWLKRHFDFNYKDIIFANDKSLIDGDVLIDDKAETILGWNNGLAVLRDRPWNRAADIGICRDRRTDKVRAYSWDDIIREAKRVKTDMEYEHIRSEQFGQANQQG